MALYIGEVHSNTFGIDSARGADSAIRGEYRGQGVTLNSQTKSLVEQANEMDDYVVVRRQQKPQLKNREVRDKKRLANQNRLLAQFVTRLDRRQQGEKHENRKYKDCASKLKRLKQRASTKSLNQSLEGNKVGEMSLDGRKLSELILSGAAESFPEVTEQDNMIEYLEALEDAETGEAESEIRQADKMLKRLDGRTDEKSISRQESLREKISDLKEQVKFSSLFKKELADAKQTLRNLHGQEIQDGYNLIPKATDLFSSLIGQKSSDEGNYAKTVAAAYQEALCTDSLAEVMQSSYTRFGAKNWESGLNSMLELSGADIKSIDPSREPQFLISVRDLLFRVEISGQLFESIGKLQNDISSTFLQ